MEFKAQEGDDSQKEGGVGKSMAPRGGKNLSKIKITERLGNGRVRRKQFEEKTSTNPSPGKNHVCEIERGGREDDGFGSPGLNQAMSRSRELMKGAQAGSASDRMTYR